MKMESKSNSPLLFRCRHLALLAMASLAALAVPVAMADDMVLTDQGELMRVAAGKFSDFFPNTHGIGPNTRVLNLEITDSTGAVQPVLVAGTQDWRPEHSAQVVWDSQANSAILLWLSGTGQGESTLHFGSYSDGTWSPIDGLRADGRLVRFPQAPNITVTEDSYAIELSDDERIVVSRKIFHLTWREADTGRVRYSPIVFVEGLHVGWTEIITLSSVFQMLHDGDEPAVLPSNLSDLLSVQAAADQRSLLVTFAEPEFGRLGTLSVGIRPMQLVLLGDLVRDRILENQMPLNPENLVPLIEDIYANIIVIGSRVDLNPAVTEYVSNGVRQWLRDYAGEYLGDLEALAQQTRRQAINISSTVYAMETDSTPDKQLIIDVGDFLDSNGYRDELVQMLDLGVRADFSAPSIDAPKLTAYTSVHGQGLMLAWPASEGAVIEFVENRGNGWGEAGSVHLVHGIDAERAHELLRRKAR